MKIGKEKGVSIAPELIGLFFEDINFAADGGLYAELIENRSFEAKEAYGNPGRFYAVDDFGYAWKPLYQTGEEPPLMQYRNSGFCGESALSALYGKAGRTGFFK